MNFGLVVTDLFGHLINGAIAVFVYASDKDWIRFNQSNILCSVFGICMVFFGLCPLFLGSVMAVERCIGVTKPIFHSTKMTSRHVKMMLTMTILFLPSIVTMARIGINEGRSKETCETILFALRMATWNQILDPWVYILLRKAVLKNLYKITRGCCGCHRKMFHLALEKYRKKLCKEQMEKVTSVAALDFKAAFDRVQCPDLNG
ncbi:hypothetical protein IHE44_0014978 [Lamprotornis superbus]|uniref:Thromboxane A2 receptor n=1 Tax=Lamprotornis superbus TaxID=245042 RepID=A0A835TUC6_9PASS|nr:hypothetical protein IHE44_0014978 [Lamprotornis superbus]